MRTIGIMIAAVLLLMFSGCSAQTISSAEENVLSSETTSTAEITAAGENVHETDHNEEEDTMRLLIGKTEVPVTWEENESVKALMELCQSTPLTIQMSMYGGFEQVGSIGQNLPRNDIQTTTGAGDIVLYSGNQIVIFYGSNTWAYTRLGHIDLSKQEMSDLLSNGDVTITLE